MGLRFRKSVKIAPGVRLNLNKNSTSVSFGGKGAHYTVSSNERRTASVGIPGTGISYSASTSSGKGGKARDTAKSSGGSSSGRGDNDKNGCLWLLLGIALLPILLTYWLWTTDMFKLSKKARAGIIAVMWAVLIILGIVGGNNKESTQQPPMPTATIAAETPQPTAAPTSTPQPTATPTPEPTATPEPAEAKPTMVYIANSGTKYHRLPSCSGMENPTEVTLEQAESWGYTPCKRCY